MADLGQLIEWLTSDDEVRKLTAAEELARRGPAAGPALNELVRLLDDPRDDLCVAAVRAIAAMGPPAAPAVPHLVSMARRAVAAGRGIPEYNCWAVPEVVVGSFGLTAVPALVAELGADPVTDEVPENMLVQLGEGVLPSVVKVLEEGGPRAASAAQVIWRLGGKAKAALPSLVRAVQRGLISEGVFVFAVSQTGIADNGVMTELRRLAKEARDEDTRRDAEQALRMLQEGTETRR